MKSGVQTDGTSALYRWTGCGGALGSLALFDGSQQTVVPSAFGFLMDYRLSSGWAVALFSTAGPAGMNLMWRRSPAGVEDLPARPFEYPLLLESVGSDGSFIYMSGRTRHLVDAKGVNHDIGLVHGRVYHSVKTWYVALGRSVFRIDP